MTTQETADTFINKGEEFQKQLEIGKENAIKSMMENTFFLRDYYYNKNNNTNLGSMLKIYDLLYSLKTYDGIKLELED